MNRWGARILALLMLVIFMLLMLNLQRQLLALLRDRGGVPATTTSSNTMKNHSKISMWTRTG
jgi:hypothetical protein